jgi:small-conductance mechanosensitive channel
MKAPPLQPVKPVIPAFARTITGLLIFASLATAVFAQQTDQTSQSKPDARQTPRVIPSSHISVEADEAAMQLRALRNRPVADLEIDRIAEEVPHALESYEELIELTENRLSGNVSIRTVDDLHRRWARAHSEIRNWHSRLIRRAQSIERDLTILLDMQSTWSATLDASVEAGLQEPLLRVIRVTLEEIEKDQRRFGAYRVELLGTETQIYRAEDIIGSAFEQLNAARVELRVRLYAFDSLPLWKVLMNPPPRTVYFDLLRAAWAENYEQLGIFVVDYQDWLILHALFFIGMAVLLFTLNRRLLRLQSDDPKLEPAAQILSRPVSASFVFSIVILLMFYYEAPRIVDELITVLCFVPLLRILPPKLLSRTRGLLFWLIGLHLLARLTDLLPYEALLRRLLLFLISAITLFIVLHSVRKDTASHFPGQSGWRTAIRRLEKTALVLLSAALLANLLGNLSLCEVVVNSVILSAYGGLVLYALYLIVESVVRIGLGTRFVRKLRMVRRHEELIRRRTLAILRIVLVLLWIAGSLNLLQVLPVITGLLRRVLTAQARFGEIGLSLGDVLGFAITVWVSFLISKVLRFVLDEDVFPRLTLPRGVPHAVGIALHYVILFLGFLLAVAATGADLGKFTLMAGAFGVGIGFGLQNIVNNFISGLILIAERPIMPGDTIEVGKMIGDVKRIGMRSSTIRTWEGAEVIVPNGNLISSEVINWTLSDSQRRVDIPVGVAYGSPTKKVIEILVGVASNHKDVMDNPAPYALFLGFGDSSLDFVLRFWTARFHEFVRVRSQIVLGIEEALKEGGIVIPFPQRDLHLKTVKPDAGKTLRGDDTDVPSSRVGFGEQPEEGGAGQTGRTGQKSGDTPKR